jgi:hypothetical protein
LRKLWIRLPTDRTQAALAVVRVERDHETLASGAKAAAPAVFRNIHSPYRYH